MTLLWGEALSFLLICRYALHCIRPPKPMVTHLHECDLDCKTVCIFLDFIMLNIIKELPNLTGTPFSAMDYSKSIRVL